MLSEHIFFVTERISDILNLEIKPDPEVGQAILRLSQELSKIHNYVRNIEAKGELLDHRVLLELNSVADCSDNILDCVTNNMNPTEINKLVERIVKFYQTLSSSQSNSYLNIENNIINNINYGDHAQQCIGPFVYNISTSNNHPKQAARDPCPKSCGHVQDRYIVGFGNEVQTLLSYLMEHDGSPVVGIVGMGGSGKTTLAKHIYHHPDIKECFPIKAWACISQSWNKMQILCEILRKTQGTSIEESRKKSEEEIVEVLIEFLSLQPYLIVLDDVWDVSAWNDICLALPTNEKCKIIVTTRKIDVLTCICVELPLCIVEPKPLNDEDSEMLLCTRTFPGVKHPQNQFKDVGTKTALKVCGGLPLAINALAGLLRVNSKGNWSRITQSLAEIISQRDNLSPQGRVDEILELSYFDLPHHLKLCVVYLCVFPEDHEIRAKQLIQMWIAECLVTCPNGNNQFKASKCLNEMTRRYIVQDVKTNCKGDVKSFRIHDLIRQMCVQKAREIGIFKDSLRLAPIFTMSHDEQESRYSLKAKHCIESVERILGPEKSSHVRSLVTLQFSGASLEQVELRPLFEKFRLLRVLILIGTINTDLPPELGNLIHLRYLELTGDDVGLPSSVANLQNLCFLKIQSYVIDNGPPIHVWKMKNLQHLSLSLFCETEKWTELNLDKLKKLKTLWISRGGDWMLSEIPKLNPGIQKLGIHFIESAEQLESVFRIPSIKSKNLEALDLDWSTRDEVLLDMSCFRKCKSLEKLKLWGGIQETKSKSVVLPANLIKLELYSCRLKDKNVMNIIAMSCVCLKILTLGLDAYIGTELVCSANSFLQLENFKFSGLKNVQMWIIRNGSMPNLKQLTIKDCDKLDLEDEGYVFIVKLPQVNYHRTQLQSRKRGKRKNHFLPTTFENKLEIWRNRYRASVNVVQVMQE